MSAERSSGAPPVSTVPRARFVLWVAQWVAAVLVPAWLVVGTIVFSGGDLSVVFIMFLFAPVVLGMLLIAGTLSVGITSAQRARGGPWYVWLLVSLWVCIGVQALLIEGGFDTIMPSGLERLGLPEAADHSLISLFFWAAAVLFVLACISTGFAGAAPPFGDGSNRELRQRAESLSRAAPDADSRS